MEILDDVEIVISAVIGKKNITIKELTNIANGDIINMNSKVTDPIRLYVNDILIAQGELINSESGLGIKIKEIVARNEKK